MLNKVLKWQSHFGLTDFTNLHKCSSLKIFELECYKNPIRTQKNELSYFIYHWILRWELCFWLKHNVHASLLMAAIENVFYLRCEVKAICTQKELFISSFTKFMELIVIRVSFLPDLLYLSHCFTCFTIPHNGNKIIRKNCSMAFDDTYSSLICRNQLWKYNKLDVV